MNWLRWLMLYWSSDCCVNWFICLLIGRLILQIYPVNKHLDMPCPETRAMTCARVHTQAKSSAHAKNRLCQRRYRPYNRICRIEPSLSQLQHKWLSPFASITLFYPILSWMRYWTCRVQKKVEPSSGSNLFMYNLPHFTASILKFPMLPVYLPLAISPDLHASELSSSEIFLYNYCAFLKTGTILINLLPAHSRGAVTFSGLCGHASATRNTVLQIDKPWIARAIPNNTELLKTRTHVRIDALAPIFSKHGLYAFTCRVSF